MASTTTTEVGGDTSTKTGIFDKIKGFLNKTLKTVRLGEKEYDIKGKHAVIAGGTVIGGALAFKKLKNKKKGN